jgi:hypothetical protein
VSLESNLQVFLSSVHPLPLAKKRGARMGRSREAIEAERPKYQPLVLIRSIVSLRTPIHGVVLSAFLSLSPLFGLLSFSEDGSSRIFQMSLR